MRTAHQVDRRGVAQPRRVQVERGDEPEASARNEADPDARSEPGIAEVEPAACGEPQQGGLETGCIPDREELLGVRAGAAGAPHLPRHVEVDVEPAVAGLCMAFAAAHCGRLGGVEDVRLLDHAASFRGCCRSASPSRPGALASSRPAPTSTTGQQGFETAVSGTARRPVPPMPSRGAAANLVCDPTYGFERSRMSTKAKRLITLPAAGALLLLAALAVAGCGGGGSSSSGPPTTPSGAAATVGVSNEGLGNILVNSQGRTLYLFTRDSGTMSECSGACAVNWPPLKASGKPTIGSGANASLTSTTSRPGGSKQVTYNGHPLYLFKGDKSPGDTNGQGLNAFGGSWYALSAAGDKVSKQPSSSGGGYGY